MAKRFLPFFVCFLLLFWGLIHQAHPHSDTGVPGTENVHAIEAPLRRVIETKLGKDENDPITITEMRGMIGQISGEQKGITNVTGLEHATGIRKLSLQRNSITDISPLAGLTTALRDLNLQRNPISDISALRNMVNLEILNVDKSGATHNIKITDISPLSGLTALKTLRLERNQIRDISALTGLTNLTDIDLRRNQITDLTPLRNLSSLKRLRLDRNYNITDLSRGNTRLNLTSLESLYMSALNISDLRVLNKLPDSHVLKTLALYLMGAEDTGGWVLKDIKPFVDLMNAGKVVGSGTSLYLLLNYALDYESLYTHIPTLLGTLSTVGYSPSIPGLVRRSAEQNVGRPGTRYTFVVGATNTTTRSGTDYVNRRFGKVPVTWTVTSPARDPVVRKTGSDGLSRFSLTLGEHGEEYTVTAEVPAKTNAMGPSHPLLGPITFTVRSDRNAPIPHGVTVTFEDYPEKPPIQAFPLTIVFSEPVTRFQKQDITVETQLKQGKGNPAILKSLIPVEGPAQTYTATIQVPPKATGTVSLIVPLGAALGSISGQVGPAENTESEPIPFGATHTTGRILTRCGLGWAPQSQFQHHRELPKVMIYALEFEYDPARNAGYRCKAIEIRTGDDSIENLAGWKLYLGKLYNPARDAVKIPEAHSQVTDGILRLTPEMLGLETFPCNTVYLYGNSHPVPGFHYVLWTDENVLVDVAYSCFIWGQNAYTTVNDVNVESPRRVSSAGLREMEVPRLERYISNNTDTFIFTTYMAIEDLRWDRAVLSDWLLPERKDTDVGTPNAPSRMPRKLGTTWGALKNDAHRVPER